MSQIPSRTTIFKKMLRKIRSPSDLKRYLNFKFVTGNEYPYFDLIDQFPWLGKGINAIAFPQRLELDTPVFIAGLRRSGTTLLYRILNANEDLILFNERFPGDRLHGRGTSTEQNILYGDYNREEFYQIALNYMGPGPRIHYQRWGVKLAMELAHPHPGSIAHSALCRILDAFPLAKIILITRDPRDFVMSALKRGGHDIQWWIDEYLALITTVDALRQERPEAMTVIKYEDLLTSPQQIMADCCTFSSLSFNPKMIQPENWSIKGPREYENRGIAANINKWKTADESARKAIEKTCAACFPAAESLGYHYDPA